MDSQKTSIPTGPRAFSDLLERCYARGKVLETPEIETSAAIVPEVVEEIKLKYWPDDKACLPNEWVRSGIFSTSNKLKYVAHPLTGKIDRIHHYHLPIPTWSENVKIFYTGHELTVFDLRVWMTCIMLAKHCFLEKIISVTPYDFCEAARLVRGGKTVKIIYDSLDRLFHAGIKSKLIQNGQVIREYNDHMIEHFKINNQTDRWEIALNRKFFPMFQFQTTWVDWDIWNSLTSDIAKSLMLQVCSHEAHSSNPQKISLIKLKEFMRNSSPNFRFRQMIKTHLPALVELGVIKTFEFNQNVLIFTRK